MQLIRLCGETLIVENGTVGTSSQNATKTGRATPLQGGVRIKAALTNTGTIFVGTDDVSSNKGYPLTAGEEVFVPIHLLSKLFVVADLSSQVYYVIAS